MPDFRTIDAGEARLRCAIEGAGPLVVLVHGFPESWFSWRHQLGPIAQTGFTACAIDVRSYGGSYKPDAIEAYAMEHMISDVAGVIEKLSDDGKAAFALTERVKMQIRAESFNFANHTNLGQPNTCVDCPGVAGRIFNTIANYVPRQWQMAARFAF